ncbi:MAG: hypothetical protein ACE15C_02975 [Phycisphaerae bacterium]
MAPSKTAAILMMFIAALAFAAGDGATDGASVPLQIQQALDSLAKCDFAAAEEQARSLASRPDDAQPRMWLIVASARQEQKLYAGAIRAYRTYLATSPAGELRQYVLDQIAACEAGLAEPKPLTPPSKGLQDKDLDDLAKVEDEVATESSEHFVVRSRNAKLSKLVVGECENSLARICRSVLSGQEFPHSVEVHVWTDSREYLANARSAPEWSGGSFSISTAGGVVTRRIDLTQLDKAGKFDTVMIDRVLPHELCHLVSKEYFGDAACPLFLDEGLAMMSESAVDGDRTLLAGSVLAGKEKIPLEGLFTRARENCADKGGADVFYAESLSFTEFLHGRLTERQFKDFLEHVKGGCTVADAVQRALYVSSSETFLPALASAWEDCALQQAQVIRALRGEDPIRVSKQE